jgi:(p)ppGpp synthase/HD superfamily hydrolase
MIAAALLHDVIEDTGCTFTDIHMSFGIEIATLVGWLTDVSKPEDGNRATRKAIDRAHTAEAPAEAQTIKLADLISNSRSIMAHDPEFAKVYLAEKRLLLQVLTKGDRGLHARASEMVGV